MVVIAYDGSHPLDYVSKWFKKDTNLNVYQFVITLVKGRLFWPVSEKGPLLPLMVKRMPSRPTKKRKRSH